MTAITLVLDHPDFVVVNKPAGIAVHAHDEPTLLSLLRQQLDLIDLHPVHRLDLATSGLLILAKTPAANSAFCQAFALRKVQKIYVALATGKPKQKQGWVKGDMEKARGGSYKLVKHYQNPALTYLQSFGQQGTSGKPLSRLWVMRPITGKTHQLRVALKSLGAPILGDERYGGVAADRLYLHALALRFCYGAEQYSLFALPQTGNDFATLSKRLDELGDPWLLPWPASFNKLDAVL